MSELANEYAIRRATLTGTGPLIRLALRRDRVRLPIWVALVAVLPAVTASSFAALLPTDEARAGYAAGVTANPALLSIQGPIFGTSLGAVTAARTLTFAAALVALLSVLTVVRHTRAEEEAGRRELLGSTVVGRQAGLAAAVAVMLGTDVLLAVAVAAGSAGAGLPVGGAVALGLALAGVGAVFAAVAGVAAQLTESARAATGIGLAGVGAAFLLRAAGDAGSATWLSWISPLGWAARVQPWADEQWWVLVLFVGGTSALLVAAFVLSAGRDLAAGVLPPRLGPTTAGRALSDPFGLAWRLHRGTLLGWTAGFALTGAAFGGIAHGVGGLLDSSPQIVELLRQLGGTGGLVELFLSTEFDLLGLLAAAYAVAAALRLRSEEVDGRAEAVLATAVGRVRWTGSHLLVALLGPAVALLAAGLAAGLVYGTATGDAAQVPRLVGSLLVQLPAVWVLAGIALALFGTVPRLVVGAWAALVAFVVVGQFGALLRLDQWLRDLSPFTHLPRALTGDVTVAPLLWLVLVAAALVAVGLLGIRRRDVG